MTLVLLILSVPLMGISAHLFVDKVVALAHKMRLPLYGIAAGLVSILTSVPEILVSISTAMSGQIELSMGNIWGSVLANTLLVVGVSACFKPLTCRETVSRTEMPFFLMGLVFWGILVFLDASSILIWVAPLLWCGYMMWVHQAEEEEVFIQSGSWWNLPLAFIYFGLIWIASLWMIDGAQWVAEYFSLPQWFVGITILAVGTSLPELVVSVVALIKGHADLALGNVVGSNMFLIFILMPCCVFLGGSEQLMFVFPAILMAMGANALLYVLILFFDHQKQVNRWEGGLMLMAYLMFLWFEYQ